MKVKFILNDLLSDVTPQMHKVRRASLNALEPAWFQVQACRLPAWDGILIAKQRKNTKSREALDC